MYGYVIAIVDLNRFVRNCYFVSGDVFRVEVCVWYYSNVFKDDVMVVDVCVMLNMYGKSFDGICWIYRRT